MKKLMLSILLAIIAFGSTGCIAEGFHHHSRVYIGPPVIIVPGPPGRYPRYYHGYHEREERHERDRR